MKRSLSLLLAVFLLTASLTACGRRDKNNMTTDETVHNNTATDQNNTTNDQHSVMDDLENAGEDVVHGAENVGEAVVDGTHEVGDALTGNNTTADHNTGGVSYGQMLDNGHVDDTNGNLQDQETTTRSRTVR